MQSKNHASDWKKTLILQCVTKNQRLSDVLCSLAHIIEYNKI